MGSALRFLWLAGRGHRWRPWRSPFLRWRIETFSGLAAESIGPRQFFAFTWRQRGELARFLRWTAEMGGHRRHAQRVHQSAQAGPSDNASQGVAPLAP